MNPDGFGSDVLDYVDALLNDSPPPQAEGEAQAQAPAPAPAPASAPEPEPEPVSESVAPSAPAPAPALAAAPAPAPASTPAFAVPAFTPQDMTPQTPPVPPLAAVQPPTIAIAQAARWLRVVVGADSYALELLRVQEVVRVVPIVPMRGAAPAVLGVMNLRGRIVPVYDLGLWLRAGQVSPDEHSRIVVVERDDELIGVLVSAVEDVVTLGRDRIEPPLQGSAPGVILGVARVGACPTVLFDAYALYG